MAPRAPWDITPDSDANDALAAQLRQSTIECAALTEQIRLKDEEMGRWRMDRDDALARARSEEERGRVLEDGARKVGEVSVRAMYDVGRRSDLLCYSLLPRQELKRERDRVRVLEDALEHEREEKNQASREVRFIEQGASTLFLPIIPHSFLHSISLHSPYTVLPDLTNAAAHNASQFATERTTLEKRIAQLERQLASSSSASTSTSNVSQARISELESKLETLERENARLTEASTSTSLNINAFASPARNRKGPGIIDSNPFSPSSPSSPFPSSSSWTPKPATGTRRTTTTRPTRPRSSSLTLPSDPSSRVPALESEISRLSSESSGLQSKLSKAQNELLKAQNESMALEARMRTDKADWEALVEQREDEIAELRYLLESSPSHEGSSPRDHEEDAELRSQLAAKERKLRAIREGLSGIEEGLVTRVREVQAGLDERRGRTPTPPSSTSTLR